MTDQYKNLITWTDRSAIESGHVITRTRLSDGQTTQIVNLSSESPFNSVGNMQYVDTDVLTPGDYEYTVQNYTGTNMVGTNVLGEPVDPTASVTRVTIIDQSKHVLCMNLKDNFADFTDTHAIGLSADNVTFSDNGAQFGNSYITYPSPISLTDKFTISFEIVPVSPTSIPGTIITSYNDCLLYTSPSPRDLSTSRMPSSA